MTLEVGLLGNFIVLYSGHAKNKKVFCKTVRVWGYIFFSTGCWSWGVQPKNTVKLNMEKA